eukprot:6181953-Pyramimonas_sp.AAC.1
MRDCFGAVFGRHGARVVLALQLRPPRPIIVPPALGACVRASRECARWASRLSSTPKWKLLSVRRNEKPPEPL